MPDKPVGKHDESASEQVDLSALRADDALLDAVARPGRDESSEELFGLDADAAQQRLGAVLLAWRRKIDSEPIGELVSVERASTALTAGRPKRRPRLSLVPLAAAAALLVIVCAGLPLAAHSAMPGDLLWGVSKVLYSERAESVQAAAIASKQLDDARRALASGNIDEARRALAEASNKLSAVRPEEGRNDLTAQQDMLQNELQGGAPPGRAAGSPRPAEDSPRQQDPPRQDPPRQQDPPRPGGPPAGLVP